MDQLKALKRLQAQAANMIRVMKEEKKRAWHQDWDGDGMWRWSVVLRGLRYWQSQEKIYRNCILAYLAQ